MKRDDDASTKETNPINDTAPLNTVACPSCGKNVDDRAVACPNCGEKIYVEHPGGITPTRHSPKKPLAE